MDETYSTLDEDVDQDRAGGAATREWNGARLSLHAALPKRRVSPIPGARGGQQDDRSIE